MGDLNRLVADFDAVPSDMVKPLTSAIKFTATEVKKNAAKKVGSREWFAPAAAGIDYDVTASTREGLEAEVGYNKARRDAAKLGNLAEFGAPNSPNSLAPGNELQRALHENEPDFVKGITKAIDDTLKKRGL